MWFDTEICEGVSCHECSFNKGEDGCLLAKRLDEIEIIPEPCEYALKKIKNALSDGLDYVQTLQALDILKDVIGITLHVVKISKHCSDFSDLDEVPECEGAVSKEEAKWGVFCNCDHAKNQANAFDELPSAQPEIIRCKECKHSRFFDSCFYCYELGGEIIVPENGFCFMAERKTDE